MKWQIMKSCWGNSYNLLRNSNFVCLIAKASYNCWSRTLLSHEAGISGCHCKSQTFLEGETNGELKEGITAITTVAPFDKSDPALYLQTDISFVGKICEFLDYIASIVIDRYLESNTCR